MKKIIAFVGSNSTTSINRQLVGYASKKVKAGSMLPIYLSACNVPLFCVDLATVSRAEPRAYANAKGVSALKFLIAQDGEVIRLNRMETERLASREV